MSSPSCCQRKESNWKPAYEVGEDKQGHPFGDSGVVGVPGLGASDRTVHLEVAAHQDEEGHSIYDHEKDDVAFAESSLGLKG